MIHRHLTVFGIAVTLGLSAYFCMIVLNLMLTGIGL